MIEKVTRRALKEAIERSRAGERYGYDLDGRVDLEYGLVDVFKARASFELMDELARDPQSVETVLVSFFTNFIEMADAERLESESDGSVERVLTRACEELLRSMDGAIHEGRNGYDRDRGHDRDRGGYDRDRGGYDRDRGHGRDRGRDHGRDRGRDRDRNYGGSEPRIESRPRDRDRHRDRDRGRDEYGRNKNTSGKGGQHDRQQGGFNYKEQDMSEEQNEIFDRPADPYKDTKPKREPDEPAVAVRERLPEPWLRELSINTFSVDGMPVLESCSGLPDAVNINAKASGGQDIRAMDVIMPLTISGEQSSAVVQAISECTNFADLVQVVDSRLAKDSGVRGWVNSVLTIEFERHLKGDLASLGIKPSGLNFIEDYDDIMGVVNSPKVKRDNDLVYKRWLAWEHQACSKLLPALETVTIEGSSETVTAFPLMNDALLAATKINGTLLPITRRLVFVDFSSKRLKSGEVDEFELPLLFKLCTTFASNSMGAVLLITKDLLTFEVCIDLRAKSETGTLSLRAAGVLA